MYIPKSLGGIDGTAPTPREGNVAKLRKCGHSEERSDVGIPILRRRLPRQSAVWLAMTGDWGARQTTNGRPYGWVRSGAS